MKTLYEYFIAVYADELDNYVYPKTKKALTEELKKTYYVGDLRLSSLIDISFVIGKPFGETINILFKLKEE